MLLDLPNAIPGEAWTVLADAFRGKVPDKIHATKVAWNVLGYVARVATGDKTPPMVGSFSEADAAALCDDMANGVVKGGIPWLLLLPMIRILFEKLIAGDVK